MRVIPLLLLAPLLILASESSSPWVNLLPAKNLEGWRSEGGSATYRLEGGELIGQSVPNSPNTFLCTEKKWGDFELEYEFLCDPSLNSGVQIRSEVIGSTVTGYQIEIDVDEGRKRFWSAGVFEEGGRGWLDDLSDNEAARNAHRLGDWNHVRVVAVGDRIQTWLNGVEAADLIDPVRQKGFIGLQVHGVGGRKEPLEIRWRAMRIRDLGEHRWQSMANFSFADPEKDRVEPQETVATAICIGRTLRMRTRLESQRLTLFFRGVRVVMTADTVSFEESAKKRAILPVALAKELRSGARITLARSGQRATLHVGDTPAATLAGLADETAQLPARWQLIGAGLRVWDVAALIPANSR